MSALVLLHILTGLAGIASGAVVVAGMLRGRRAGGWDAAFLVMTFAACATGFVFLPSMGVTSAQLVSFFVTFLLGAAAWARYVGRLVGTWNQVYAFAVVGALYMDILITTAQSFLHVPALKALAPTQASPVYVGVKVALVVVFIGLAVVTARRAGRC